MEFVPLSPGKAAAALGVCGKEISLKTVPKPHKISVKYQPKSLD